MNDVNILIVDDEEVVLESCDRALSDRGYSVAKAKNVDDAIAKIGKTDFDVVIVDLVMPKKSGMELLKFVKSERPLIQVIMITGYSSINTAVESMKLGAFDYLSKPFTPYELVITVKNALDKKGKGEHGFFSDKQPPSVMIFDNIVGSSPRMVEIFKLISKISATDANVLITGESGTGKELIAKSIHRNSNRSDNNFVVVDCLSLSANLLESELFGHVKGSFTGAVNNKAGFFEVANKGSLFLDEIGDLGMELQGKLLRVIQERSYIPVGGTDPKHADIRLIAATNKDLRKMVEAGTFREDLFYRLYVVPIHMPALRERKEDIPLLVELFMNKLRAKYSRTDIGVSVSAMDSLMAYDWPGNVRELENTIERAFVSCEEKEILSDNLPASFKEISGEIEFGIPSNIDDLKSEMKKLRLKSVEEIERRFVINALVENGWKVSRAAASVGMQRTNFYRMMKKHNIAIPGEEEEEA